MILTKRDAMKAVNKKYTEKIVPLEPVETDDGKGGYKTDWQERQPSMAEIRKTTVKTEEVSGAFSSVVFRELAIRYRIDIQKDWKLILGNNQKCNVEGTYNYGKETTILICKEVNK